MLPIRSSGMAAPELASVPLAACGGEDENLPPARVTIITGNVVSTTTIDFRPIVYTLSVGYSF